MPADPSPNDASTTDRPSSRARAAAPAIAIGLTILVTLLLFLQTRSLGLMGHDSYPIILTSRIESLGDFIGTFVEELMDGRYSGDYYRPLLNLTFAVDYAIYGLEPLGYQLTGVLLFGAAALAMFFLARRLCGGAAVYGPLLALLMLLLHESQFEVLPVPPRRPELLCALFAFLSLYSQLGGKQLARRWPWVPALWMGCAVLSKETALVMPAFSFVAVWLYSTHSGARERTVHALRAIAAHALMIVILVGIRLAVLGGIGGPGPAPPMPAQPGALDLSTQLVLVLVAPGSWVGFRTSLMVLAGLLVLFVVSLSLRRWMVSRTGGGAATDTSPMRTILFASIWFLGICVVYGMTGRIERWYFFLPVAGLSLLSGGVLELLLQVARGSDPPTRLRARAGLPLLLAFVFLQVRYSPLFHDYPEWERASLASDGFFEELEKRLENVRAGKAIAAPSLPVWVEPSGSGAAILGGAVLSDYSVQAWCELVHPERKIRVISRPGAAPPDADEVVLMIQRVREGFAPGGPRPREGR